MDVSIASIGHGMLPCSDFYRLSPHRHGGCARLFVYCSKFCHHGISVVDTTQGFGKNGAYMTVQLIDEFPHFGRYAVGDCEMLKRDLGSWIHVDDVSNLLDWIAEHDDRDVMLAKIQLLDDKL